MTNGNGNGTQHSDWDERREQLSAYLDGELVDAAREQLEAHLADCADCRRELAELRQVRALLRALPTPALPRSFTLPVEESAATPPVAPSTRSATTTPRAARRGSRWARATQWTGSLAASVGLLLILGSALAASGPHIMNGAASYAPQSSSAQRSGNAPAGAGGAATHSATTGTQDQSTRSAHALTPSTPTPAPFAPNAGPENTAGAPTPPPTSTVLGVTGAGLAGGGALLFIGGTVARRRRGKKR